MLVLQRRSDIQQWEQGWFTNSSIVDKGDCNECGYNECLYSCRRQNPYHFPIIIQTRKPNPRHQISTEWKNTLAGPTEKHRKNLFWREKLFQISLRKSCLQRLNNITNWFNPQPLICDTGANFRSSPETTTTASYEDNTHCIELLQPGKEAPCTWFVCWTNVILRES